MPRFEFQYDGVKGHLSNYGRYASNADAIDDRGPACDRIFNLGYEEPVQIWERPVQEVFEFENGPLAFPLSEAA